MGGAFLDSDREIDSDPIYLPRAIGGRPRETGDISGDVFSRDWAADQLAQGVRPFWV
jgi:hypothetical protein